MNQLILTKDGLIPCDALDVTDVIEWHDNFRVTATEWKLKADFQRFDGLDPDSKEPIYTVVPAGEMVRRDVVASCLRGVELSGQQAQL